jgi:hypothetical protein
VNPHVLQQDALCAGVGGDAIFCIIIDGKVRFAIARDRGNAIVDALGVTREFDTLHVDILRPVESENLKDAESAE